MKQTPQKIVIIGASSGIGKALAEQYAARGAYVGITGRRKELLDAIQSKFPETIHVHSFDARSSDNLHHLDTLIHTLGGMDLFIYNAGYGEISDELDWTINSETFDINARALHEMVHYAFNYFIKKGKGQIAVTSSIASIRGNSQAPVYSATKAFASTFCEGLSIKASKLKKPVFITDIQPGFIATVMAKGKGRFWEAPVEKAAAQMIKAIDARKRRVYITKRWAFIAWVMKWIPYSLYKKIG